MRVRTIVGVGLLLVILIVNVAAALYWSRQMNSSAAQPPTPVATEVAVAATLRPTDVLPVATATTEAQPPPAATPSPSAPPPPATPTLSPPDESWRTLRQDDLPTRDLVMLAGRFGRAAGESGASGAPIERRIGEQRTFFVSNLMTSEKLETPATLLVQTKHAQWWVADDVTVDADAVARSAETFEAQSYPTNRALFGSEWSPGVDGDPRVNIFLGEVPGVGGYFSGADEVPRAANPFSNEMEIFYINLNNARPGEPYFDGILAHEFQHMIHWNEDRNESLWINEGLSELAAAVNGFPVVSSAAAFLSQPDLPITYWQSQTHPYYAAAHLVTNYFHELYGDGALRQLVETAADGTAAFDQLLPSLGGTTFDDLFGDLAVALLINDPRVGDGRYAIERIDFEPPAPTLSVGTFPASGEGEVHQYGLDILAVEPAGAAGTVEATVRGTGRVRLLPTAPFEGEWMLWSRRGDDISTIATRAFDLRGVAQATLRFQSWYDLEPDFDYAYVSASADGGATWTILPATESTNSNPNGNSFGPAFSGRSGGGTGESAARWVEQVVDLTPLAGEQILLRFEMIADDAINHPGLAVDRVEIPELDYVEGFESGLGGWETAGFARVAETLPQPLIVRAVALGAAGPTLLPVEQEGTTYRVRLENEAAVEQVLLVLSGANPFTTEPAVYEYTVRLQP